jgi:hypothetical protein
MFDIKSSFRWFVVLGDAQRGEVFFGFGPALLDPGRPAIRVQPCVANADAERQQDRVRPLALAAMSAAVGQRAGWVAFNQSISAAS